MRFQIISLKIIILLFSYKSFATYASYKNNIVDFDISMGKGTSFYKNCVEDQKNQYFLCSSPSTPRELFDFFKKLYNQNNFDRVVIEKHPKIPLIIHMQWLGGEFPACYWQFRDSWVANHPQWTHILWVDNPVNYKFGLVIEDWPTNFQDILEGKYAGQTIVLDVKSLNYENKKYFNASKDIGEKTDITAYEYIYQFGGVYIDTDFECLKPLDVLHHAYDFYIGIQPLDETLALGKGIFGATRENPILKHCIETIKDDRQKKDVINRTGPVHCTRSFYQIAKNAPGINIAFPASFFYPIRLNQKHLNREAMNAYITPESFGIHHWAGSWISQNKKK